MTTQSRPLINAGYAPAVEASGYESARGTYTIIDKMTARNNDTASRTLTLRIVASGGTASAAHTIVVKALYPGETYTFPEMVGQVLAPGDFVSELASAASAITRRMSGRTITA